MSVTDQLLNVLSEMLASGSFWLVVALIVALVVMQGVKAVIKQMWPLQWNPKWRTWLTFLLAYVVGFQCGAYFLDGSPDAHRWASFVGFINPIIYFGLVQYATAKNKIILLSVLKMRPIVEVKGEWKLHSTQTFMARK